MKKKHGAKINKKIRTAKRFGDYFLRFHIKAWIEVSIHSVSVVLEVEAAQQL